MYVKIYIAINNSYYKFYYIVLKLFKYEKTRKYVKTEHKRVKLYETKASNIKLRVIASKTVRSDETV